MKRKRWIAGAAVCMLAAVMALGGCGAKNGMETAAIGETISENHEKTRLIFWHYYNDAQKKHLDQLIKEYNETEGKARNVVVEAFSQGSIDDLTNKINLILNESSNEVEMANMFLAYRDMLVNVVKKHPEKLVDAQEYLSREELDSYNQDYLTEGIFDGNQYILPIAKSTELLLMNQTELSAFLKANPQYSVEDMAAWSGLEKVAQGYFEWTDARTPEVEGDGIPFVGMDNLANYFIAMNHAMGSHIYYYDEDGRAKADLNEDYVKNLFLNYYKPFTKGYYGAKGRYRSDDVKQSMLAGYIGSSSSVLYFPDEVADPGGEMVPIEIGVYPYPKLTGYRETAIQQGAGVVVLNRSQKENQACMDFIHWLTFEKGVEMATSMSYMPVGNEAMTEEQEASIQNPKVRTGIKEGIAQSSRYQMVHGFDFENSYDVRVELGDAFKLALEEGREEFLSYLEESKTIEEAVSLMDYDSKADAFYQEIKAVFEKRL